MQKVLFSNGIAKAVIAEGDMADIQGCFPKCIRNTLRDGENCIRLGRGLMTTFTVMGTALIRAVNFAEKAPSGGLLLIHESLRSHVPPDIHPENVHDTGFLSIDWVHTKTESLSQMQKTADLPLLGSSSLEIKLNNYMNNNEINDEWRNNTLRFLKI
jgi:hypothetical protein